MRGPQQVVRVQRKKKYQQLLEIEKSHLQNGAIHHDLVHSVDKSCLIALSAVGLRALHEKRALKALFLYFFQHWSGNNISFHSLPLRLSVTPDSFLIFLLLSLGDTT